VAEIESDLAKLSARKEELKGVKPEEEADKLVPKVDAEAIRKAAEEEAKKRAEDVKKKFDELNAEYESVNGELKNLGEEQQKILSELREQFDKTWTLAIETMKGNLDLASAMGDKFVEVGNMIRESMEAYKTELTKKSAQVDTIFEQLKALQASVKGK
jgi:flagellar biosynthesis chaperone FliJ